MGFFGTVSQVGLIILKALKESAREMMTLKKAYREYSDESLLKIVFSEGREAKGPWAKNTAFAELKKRGHTPEDLKLKWERIK
jgi:hypothetical protein